jgi:DNA-binding response OmpR family regulator
MSGFDLLHELRSSGEFQSTPVYMVSAYGSDRAVREARDAGADGFITKPFSVSRILETIKTALGGG